MMKIFVWLLQLVAAFILLSAGWMKVAGDPGAVGLFAKLGMGNNGVLIIGVLEILAGVLLLMPWTAASGGFLGLGVMIGALIAHLTQLGFAGSTGLFVVLGCTMLIVWFRRTELPLIGDTLD